MARLYLVDPDGEGTYDFEFDMPFWLEQGMALYMFGYRAGWPAWAGFLRGCMERMAEVKAE